MPNVPELFQSGLAYLRNEKFEDAVSSFETVIREDPRHEKAYNLLGLIYKKLGRLKEAFECFETGAKFQNSSALFNLGLMYAQGEHVKQDFNHAIRYYRIAGAQGNNNALYNLAKIYLHGASGVEQDKERALDYLREAAENGDKRSIFALKHADSIHDDDKSTVHKINAGKEVVNSSPNDGFKEKQLPLREDTEKNIVSNPMVQELMRKMQEKHEQQLSDITRDKIKAVEALKMQLEYEKKSKQQFVSNMTSQQMDETRTLQSQNDNLKKELDLVKTTSNDEIKKLKAYIETLWSDIERFKAELQHMSEIQDERDALMDQLTEMKRQVKKEKSQMTLQSKLNADRNFEKQKIVSSLTEQVQNLKVELEALREKEENSSKSIGMLEKKLQETSLSLEEEKNHLAKAQSKISKREEELAELRATHTAEILQLKQVQKETIEKLQRNILEKDSAIDQTKHLDNSNYGELIKHLKELKEEQKMSFQSLEKRQQNIEETVSLPPQLSLNSSQDLESEFLKLKKELQQEKSKRITAENALLQLKHNYSTMKVELEHTMNGIENDKRIRESFMDALNRSLDNYIKPLEKKVESLGNTLVRDKDDSTINFLRDNISLLTKTMHHSLERSEKFTKRAFELNQENQHKNRMHIEKIEKQLQTFSESEFLDILSPKNSSKHNDTADFSMDSFEKKLSDSSIQKKNTNIPHSNHELFTDENDKRNSRKPLLPKGSLDSFSRELSIIKTPSLQANLQFESSQEYLSSEQGEILADFESQEQVYLYNLQNLKSYYAESLSDIISNELWGFLFEYLDPIMTSTYELVNNLTNTLIDERQNNSNTPVYKVINARRALDELYKLTVTLNSYYLSYVERYYAMLEKIRQEKRDNSKFDHYLQSKEIEHLNSKVYRLVDFIKLPVERLESYYQFISNLVHKTPVNSPLNPKLKITHQLFEKCRNSAKDLINYLNHDILIGIREKIQFKSITEYNYTPKNARDPSIFPHREFILEFEGTAIISPKRRELCHCYIFTDLFICHMAHETIEIYLNRKGEEYEYEAETKENILVIHYDRKFAQAFCFNKNILIVCSDDFFAEDILKYLEKQVGN